MNTNNQPYFKVYQSMFQNGTYVNEMTDLQKVLLMLISSEMNRKEAEGTATGTAKIMRFSHYWLSSALSSSRKSISTAFKALEGFRLFDYTPGYNINGSKSAPSTIRNLVTEEFYSVMDRYTFEYLLYDRVKKGKIQYRHIVVYAMCKYIEQFKGGSISVKEFGRMLGMTSKDIKYTRIQKPLEDLQNMKLISFERGRGKVEGIQVHTMKKNGLKQSALREEIKIEAEKLRYEELGISNKEAAAAVEDMPAVTTFEDIVSNVKDIYAKRTGRKAVLGAAQKQRIQKSQLNIQQMDACIHQFFLGKNSLELQRMDNVFNNIAAHIENETVKRYYGSA